MLGTMQASALAMWSAHRTDALSVCDARELFPEIVKDPREN
jgi:hypothetical protein